MEILDNEIDIYISSEEHEWKIFIGNNSDYYIPIWQKFQKQDTKVHFHLFALIFSVYWLGFRKMYKYAIVYLLFVQIVPLLILFLLGANGQIQAQLMLFLFLPFFGLFGNWVYYNHAQKTIATIKRTHPNETSQQKAIEEAGQTNVAFPFILLFLSLFIGNFVTLILSFFY